MSIDVSIRTEPVLGCAICHVDGKAALRDCHDYLCGLPGTWSFFECPLCRSLWLNPSPIESDIPLLYPENYGFTRSAGDALSSFPSGIRGSAKLSVLERIFGYRGLEEKADNNLGLMLGRVGGMFFRNRAGHSVRFLQQRSPGKLLDVGCGNGDFMVWMQQLGWEAEGIELDPIAAKIAAGRGLRVQLADIKNVDLVPQSFDAITMSHVAEHFSDPAKVFEKIVPFLKPGGFLVSISPNPRGFLRRWFGNKWYALDPPRHLFIPSARAYRLAGERLGLETKTWTSMRLFHWLSQESAHIAKGGAVGTIDNSASFRAITTSLAALISCWPGLGEEVICYARK